MFSKIFQLNNITLSTCTCNMADRAIPAFKNPEIVSKYSHKSQYTSYTFAILILSIPNHSKFSSDNIVEICASDEF